MRTIFIFITAIMLAGCADVDDFRATTPAWSLYGTYKATYTMRVDGTETVSSPEGMFKIGSPVANRVSELQFRTHLYGSQLGWANTPVYEMIPNPGDLYKVSSVNAISMKVDGKPYNASFKYGFVGTVTFYGDNEETMYSDVKEFSGIQILVEGWMKERKYYYDELGSASFTCEVTLKFTIEEKQYEIVITDAQCIYYES